MKPGRLFASLATLLLGLSLSIASPKTPQGGAANTGIPQMPGDNGKIGTIYKMGVAGSELLFTLDSVRVEGRFSAPDDLFVAGEHERLLILNFSVQNPVLKEQSLSSSTFKFTVVSPDDENYEFRGYLLNGTKKTHMSQSLKQAQKVKCTVVIPIHESGQVPKVIVQRGDSKVLRYDLTGKLTPMKSAFAKNSIDMFPTAGLQPYATTLQVGALDFKIDDMVYNRDEIMGHKPGPGEQYLVIKASFTNSMVRPIPVGFQYIALTLEADNGKTISWNSTLLSRCALVHRWERSGCRQRPLSGSRQRI
ncbi:MAG: hypothetical protein WCG75_09025 [Armatimonadota bacterium]